jgi:hypothetical protein
MDKIELTKEQLGTELPAEQVAEECADHLWGLLTASVQA